MTYNTEYLHEGTMIVTDSDLPDKRYVVSQDESPESPTEWNDSDTVMVYHTSYRGDTGTPEHELETVFQRVYDEDHNAELALKVTRRFARVFYGWSEERANESILTYSACGYSQGDWWDILSITHEDDYATNLAKTWEQWARGDVYIVSEEHATECDQGDIHWDATNDQGIDSMMIGGIYAEDAEDAVTQYLKMT